MKGKFVQLPGGSNDSFGIVVSEKLRVPYIPDGCGCKNYNVPEENIDVNTWPTFDGYIIFTLPAGSISVYAEHAIKEVIITDDFEGQMISCSIFDHATSGMRYHITLLEIAKKLKNWN